ncbi:MAG: TMEM165/GDT1 family protein [Thermoleophilia bacterium]|nr:TMEM165/GDT1 family protein [Thermoleophilia bacterium]
MTALLTTFLLVGIAEMADKTQLLTLCLTCRYPARKVLLGVTLAIAALNLAAVLVGGLAGELLPVRPIKIAAGLLFVAFGLWTLRGAGNDPGGAGACETGAPERSNRSAVLAVAAAFLVAEVGDKTQLATLSLAARFGSFVAVWLGASLGMLLANALAVGCGSLLGNRLRTSTLAKISALLFIAFGLWTLADAFL